ncbi:MULTISPECIES: hypothetical protein [unclassified Sphingomonas]|uniref:hypothetical protein n=1 Tax=unclassified Sphingomonas TaxID=196159 RepID=UPI0006FB634F|nr:MULTISPECIES: hypothetical protein [unclassified Sphingomonas]KQM98808.1 hypothetical protein ASE78_06165 [Sphingomonas sp. Leaf25]KQN40524.1 hypothetical protein ASE97_01685 [Sphingomonas sp. Leaf42]KQT29878.1 hypothetical protein ASG37_01660 [Sphingomonas sp. Leaf407]
MYDLIDRPLAALPPGDRFLVRAIRLWVAARTACQHPQAMLAARFAQAGALEALADFDTWMTQLSTHARVPIQINCKCGLVTDDESVLLTLARDLVTGRDAKARTTLSLLVADRAIAPTFCALARTAAMLGQVGLPPGSSVRT